MTNPIIRFELSNGLLVLLKEVHTAPLISSWIWYRVGSRDEVPGITGISHWVEHMQFKGTPRFPAGVLDRTIARIGGYWNAMTSMDWTTYYETLPAGSLELALKIEADRMTSSLFSPEEVASERTVIISERQGNENSPSFRLAEEVQAAAFRVHSYHHEVVGDMPDLEAIRQPDLYRHYRKYYTPANAVLAVAGDFETEPTRKLIREIFEPLPSNESPVRIIRPEPPQTGERRLTVEGPGETTFVQVSYRVPEATHPDFFPLVTLASLLTGPSSLSLFGDSISNKTSRLYQALVEKELAVAVYGGLQATIDPFLYSIILVMPPEPLTEKTLTALEAEIHRLHDTAPDQKDLRRAVKQARAMFAYSSESITNQAYWLGFSEMFATYDWFLTFLNQLEAVTPEDIQRVAQTHLNYRNRVLGIYRPTEDE